MAKNLTKEQAVELYESKFWESMSYEDIAKFQMMEDRLCMPFDIFHEAVEKTLKRPVWTHELALRRDDISNKLFNNAPPPTFEEIVNLIPKDKQVILVNIGKNDG